MKSKYIRNINAESDALHLGMGWNKKDLEKPQIIIESAYGESHPGSSHLLDLSLVARDGVLEAGGQPAIFMVTDICDGVAQGNKGMELSLLSRDFMAAMIEIQVSTSMCDGLLLISSCDKSLPAHLLAAARLNVPTIVIPGGCMIAGGHFLGCDQMWELRRKKEKGELSEIEFAAYEAAACPSAGACQMMGTAGTMQVLAESLGLALPGSALIPTCNNELKRAAKQAGKQLLYLVEQGINAREILTKEAFENAITVHAAVGGSTNAILHLLAIANEAGVKLDVEVFDRIHKHTPYLTNVLSTGQFPTEFFWYAGGVPALMVEIRDLLHLDVLTITGKTLGENLEAWITSERRYYQESFLANYCISKSEVIRPRSNPIGDDGGIAILKGNLAPMGAVIKHSAVDPEMRHHIGLARVFLQEDEAIKALYSGAIHEGDVIVIPYQGPKACGMPEMFRISDAIASNPRLARTTAVITDGRYSGCTRGPAIGYVSPEAFDGGPLALVRDNDVIEIDIPKRQLNLIGEAGISEGVKRGEGILAARAVGWRRPELSEKRGALGIYQKLVKPSLSGAFMI
ncbi:dihydroxy-acid dehydratase [Neomoorella humiferrea]|uniref:dihydroxy-acid dehydratase n=1 Tax=Neomoorella humiferrea TaxID=676965 RepID=UPI003D93D349